jgi:hypothetical protein
MAEPLHHHPATDDVDIQPLHGNPTVISTSAGQAGPIAPGQVAIDPNAGGGQAGGGPGSTTVETSEGAGEGPQGTIGTILQGMDDLFSGPPPL